MSQLDEDTDRYYGEICDGCGELNCYCVCDDDVDTTKIRRDHMSVSSNSIAVSALKQRLAKLEAEASTITAAIQSLGGSTGKKRSRAVSATASANMRKAWAKRKANAAKAAKAAPAAKAKAAPKKSNAGASLAEAAAGD